MSKLLKCAYCGQERPVEEMHEGTIIFQDTKRDVFGNSTRFVNKKTNWYCKDKPCCGYDQMAHEG